jgi:hypothetical protein
MQGSNHIFAFFEERCVSFGAEGKDSICMSSKSGKLSVGISLGYHFTA